MAIAYAVLIVDVATTPPTVKGAGVFSEPSPTMQGNVRCVVMFKTYSDLDNYGEAADQAWEILRGDWWSWTGSVIWPERRSRTVQP